MFVITKGYLINRQDYELFDEILTFINEHGNKFTCFSAGSRKIASKNGRNLDYLNYLEFEFFHSSQKLCRLKKVSTITYVDQKYKDKLSIFLLNDFIYQAKNINKQIYHLYQQMIFYIMNNHNDYLIMLYLLIHIIKFLNIEVEINHPIINDFFNNPNMINDWNFDEFDVNQIKNQIKTWLKQIYLKTNIYLKIIKII